MKKFSIFSKSPDNAAGIKRLAQTYGLTFTDEAPDFMITLGGDGTFLLAEAAFPGLPKLPVRDSLICYRCHDEPLPTLLEIIVGGCSIIKSFPKLSVTVNKKKLVATNEITIRNSDQRRALRFKVCINGDWLDEVFIGDGLVIATQFGSTGYYKAITRHSFKQGVGIAFNNIRIARSPVLLEHHCCVELLVTREKGIVSADNQAELFTISKGESATIQDSNEVCRYVTH